jgi:hypothetical protein
MGSFFLFVGCTLNIFQIGDQRRRHQSNQVEKSVRCYMKEYDDVPGTADSSTYLAIISRSNVVPLYQRHSRSPAIRQRTGKHDGDFSPHYATAQSEDCVLSRDSPSRLAIDILCLRMQNHARKASASFQARRYEEQLPSTLLMPR